MPHEDESWDARDKGVLWVPWWGAVHFSTNTTCPFLLQLPSQSGWHCLVQMRSRVPRERNGLHRQVKKEFAERRIAWALERSVFLQTKWAAATNHWWWTGCNRAADCARGAGHLFTDRACWFWNVWGNRPCSFLRALATIGIIWRALKTTDVADLGSGLCWGGGALRSGIERGLSPGSSPQSPHSLGWVSKLPWAPLAHL